MRRLRKLPFTLRSCSSCGLCAVTTVIFLFMIGWDGSFVIEYAEPSESIEYKIPDRETARGPPATARPTRAPAKTLPTPGPVLHPPSGRSEHDGKWYVWTNGSASIYVYSSFLDNRTSLMSLPVVRVIGTSDLNQNRSLTCIMWFNNMTVRREGKREDIGAGVYRMHALFVEFIVSCPVLNEHHVPWYVALVPTKVDKPSFRCPVEVPRRYPVKQQLSICVSVSYWDFEPLHLIEWLETQRLLGVSHVTVYNSSITPRASRVLWYYRGQDPSYMELRQSLRFRPEPDELSYHMQMSPVINDCMYRNLYRFEKIMVIDFDEYVIPRQHWTLVELLQFQSTKVTHPAPHYLFYNTYFFQEYDDEPDEKLLTLRKRTHAPTSEYGYSAKSIIDPQSCALMHNHFCWKTTPQFDAADVIMDIPIDLAQIHHYKKCHFGEDKCKQLLTKGVKDHVVLKYKSTILRAVLPKSNALHIIL